MHLLLIYYWDSENKYEDNEKFFRDIGCPKVNDLVGFDEVIKSLE